MKHKTLIIVLFLAANVVMVIGIRYWHVQKKEQTRIMLRDATRYAGATGDTITAFDERTNRWLTEMKEETPEITLKKLTDAMEYIGLHMLDPFDSASFYSERARENTIYRKDIEAILGNRRFRKAYEDLQKMNRRQAAEFLTKNIRDNLAELRPDLQGATDMISRGDHKKINAIAIATVDTEAYRPMSPPDEPPTRAGRRYAVLSYVLLASLLELREVRPAIEEVVELAKEEYKLFNSVDSGEAYTFKQMLLTQSLYHPSLLLTATLCDPTWNADKHKRLGATRLVTREFVDYQARALEHDKDAREGWIPVVPHDGMLKIRYYRGITDEEFNDFFGK